MKFLACVAILSAAGLGLASVASAQDASTPAAPDASAQGAGVVASPPVPDTSRQSPGIPGSEAVNPAPGATGPYVGAGRNNFYDIDQRIVAVSQGVQSLPAAQRHRAMSQLRAIKSEEATQRARHGRQLRDWDRESLSVKLDRMAKDYPGLNADAAPSTVPTRQ